MATKKFLYVNRKAPHGTIYALESLEVVLISAAFDQDVSLAFLDDGVYQIVKNTDTKAVGMKNFSLDRILSYGMHAPDCTKVNSGIPLLSDFRFL